MSEITGHAFAKIIATDQEKHLARVLGKIDSIRIDMNDRLRERRELEKRSKMTHIVNVRNCRWDEEEA
jgi:hypothetical protein